MKRIVSLLLSIVLALSLTLPAMAAEQYTDVGGDEWFATAANALRERNIMNGVENNHFAPDRTFTRASLATVLYRMAGEPAVTGEDSFTDTEVGTWYSDAVLWASQNKIVNGIGGGLSGTQGTIAAKLSGATVLQGFAMQGRTAQRLTGSGMDTTVKNWLDGLGLVK